MVLADKITMDNTSTVGINVDVVEIAKFLFQKSSDPEEICPGGRPTKILAECAKTFFCVDSGYPLMFAVNRLVNKWVHDTNNLRSTYSAIATIKDIIASSDECWTAVEGGLASKTCVRLGKEDNATNRQYYHHIYCNLQGIQDQDLPVLTFPQKLKEDKSKEQNNSSDKCWIPVEGALASKTCVHLGKEDNETERQYFDHTYCNLQGIQGQDLPVSTFPQNDEEKLKEKKSEKQKVSSDKCWTPGEGGLASKICVRLGIQDNETNRRYYYKVYRNLQRMKSQNLPVSTLPQKDEEKLKAQKDEEKLKAQKDEEKLKAQKDEEKLKAQKDEEKLKAQRDEEKLKAQKAEKRKEKKFQRQKYGNESSSTFCHIEGTLTLSVGDWDDFPNINRNDMYRRVEQGYYSLGKVCRLRFISLRLSLKKRQRVYFYGSCVTRGCKKFRIVLQKNENELIATIWSNMQSANHDKPSEIKILPSKIFCHNEGTFSLFVGDWHDFPNINKIDLYHRLEQEYRSLGKICHLRFNLSRAYAKKPNIAVYGFCAVEGCKKFRAVVWRKGGTEFSATVWSDKQSVNNTDLHIIGPPVKKRSIRRPITGPRGKKWRIQKHSATKVDNTHLQECNEAAGMHSLGTGDLIAPSPKATITTIANVQLGEVLTESDEFFDVYTLSNNEFNVAEADRAIQAIGVPLHVDIYSTRQVQVLRKVIKSVTDYPIVHLDCTPFVIKPNCVGNRFYYVGVVQINDEVLPLFECVHPYHDMEYIGSSLARFRTFCEQRLFEWPIVRRVVLPHSSILVESAVKAWNDMTLIAYLNKVFALLTDDLVESHEFSSFVTLHICCKLFMQALRKWLNTMQIGNEKLKKFIVLSMTIMMYSRSLLELDDVFKYVVIVTETPVVCSEVTEAMGRLLFCSLSLRKITLHDENECDDVPIVFADSIFELEFDPCSPFQAHYACILRSTMLEIPGYSTITHSVNDLYYPGLSEMLNERYLKVAPLWTSTMCQHFHYSEGSLSGDSAEKWFNLLKTVLLDDGKGCDLPRFIKTTRHHVTAQVEILESIPENVVNDTVNNFEA